MRLFGISLRGWLKLASWTFFGTLSCIVIAVTFNYFFFGAVAPAAVRAGVVSAIVIPILLAGPLFAYLTLKLRELAIANHRLRVVAATDSLTACLTRGAFTTQVESHLDRMRGGKHGAMLVIDADHFKAINDNFGHHRGDEALRIIADGIRLSLRKSDVFGRLGGEEFGVFLPDTTPAEAALVAERIRCAVGNADFRAGGERRDLSVSIGGACFEGPMNFGELFRSADERLYAAKETGRDRVEMTFAISNALVAENRQTVH